MRGEEQSAHRRCGHIINPIITKFDGVRCYNIDFKVEDLSYDLKNIYLCTMSHVVCLYHIVISTYNREMTIPDATKRELYKYIYGIICNNQCFVYRINGIGNHIHILTNLCSTIPIATLVQAIKQGSSHWAKMHPELFPDFKGWGKEYFAVSMAMSDKQSVIDYIIRQEEHHSRKSLEEEIDLLLAKMGFVHRSHRWENPDKINR